MAPPAPPTPPPPVVVRAFGGTGAPQPLGGGQGRSWSVRGRDGTRIVVKPEGDPRETRWRAEAVRALGDVPGLRLAQPVGAGDGAWAVAGWEAWEHVAGEVDADDHDGALAVADLFHEATRDLPEPRFVSTREDPWSDADRFGWAEGERPVHTRGNAVVDALVDALEPVRVHRQPVHGDLLGNVLQSPGLPPAVIDWAVYHRPAAWAAAVVVVDALTWHGAPVDLVGREEHRGTADAPWRQVLLRAALFRACVTPGDPGAHAATARTLLESAG